MFLDSLSIVLKYRVNEENSMYLVTLRVHNCHADRHTLAAKADSGRTGRSSQGTKARWGGSHRGRDLRWSPTATVAACREEEGRSARRRGHVGEEGGCGAPAEGGGAAVGARGGRGTSRRRRGRPEARRTGGRRPDGELDAEGRLSKTAGEGVRWRRREVASGGRGKG